MNSPKEKPEELNPRTDDDPEVREIYAMIDAYRKTPEFREQQRRQEESAAKWYERYYRGEIR
ncbi:MAG: hypothetical protein AAFX06_14875 [Planctomycetota bacterium]